MQATSPAQAEFVISDQAIDITFVLTGEGRLYLAVLLDVHLRRVVGWAMALHSRRPTVGLVHHTDRGCQYTASAYQRALAARGLVCSMSRAGECLDNAMAESFFGLLKAELADRQVWPSRAVARTAIFAWIEVWYNCQRRHSGSSAISVQPVASVQKVGSDDRNSRFPNPSQATFADFSAPQPYSKSCCTETAEEPALGPRLPSLHRLRGGTIAVVSFGRLAVSCP